MEKNLINVNINKINIWNICNSGYDWVENKEYLLQRSYLVWIFKFTINDANLVPTIKHHKHVEKNKRKEKKENLLPSMLKFDMRPYIFIIRITCPIHEYE